MTFVPFNGFGKFGVVHDSPDQALPLGVWTNARNIRFSGIHMEKMLEPVITTPWDSDTNGTALWLQGWADGLSTYMAVASNEVDPITGEKWDSFTARSDDRSEEFEKTI